MAIILLSERPSRVSEWAFEAPIRDWTTLYRFNGSLSGGASLRTNIQSVAASISLDVTYGTVLVDASGAARTITLPAANICKGLVYVVKKTDSSANAVVVASAGGNIDGAATISLTTQYQSAMVQSDGTNWWVI